MIFTEYRICFDVIHSVPSHYRSPYLGTICCVCSSIFLVHLLVYLVRVTMLCIMLTRTLAGQIAALVLARIAATVQVRNKLLHLIEQRGYYDLTRNPT